MQRKLAPKEFLTEGHKLSNNKAAALFGVSNGLISRWRCEVEGKKDKQGIRNKACEYCGIKISPMSRGFCRQCWHNAIAAPVPSDFAVMIDRIGSKKAAVHYGASLSTITRWRNCIGIPKGSRGPIKWPKLDFES